ncbi:MAG: metallophosphoesterase [Lachnospiraceae bacterium]|nr:metallophosphoesterase [Lachnospiraceae bacterium]
MTAVTASPGVPVIITAIALATVLLGLFVYVQSRGFRVVRYSFINKKLKKDSYRFAFISDMHDHVHGDDNREVLEAIDREGVDAIFLAGDMVTSSMEPKYRQDNALRFIKALSSKYPVYYGIGNHEEKLRRCPDSFPGIYERLVSELDECGAHMLINEKVSIEDAGIDVYGLDLEHEYYRKLKTRWIPDDYLERRLGRNDTDRISILLAHNPEQFDKYVLWKPDYVLSGHVHGGIVNLPFLGGAVSPQLKLFPRYDAGLFEKEGSTMILNRGLGAHTIPVRVFNKAEVVVVDLYRSREVMMREAGKGE